MNIKVNIHYVAVGFFPQQISFLHLISANPHAQLNLLPGLNRKITSVRFVCAEWAASTEDCKMQILQQFSKYQQLPTHHSCPRHLEPLSTFCSAHGVTSRRRKMGTGGRALWAVQHLHRDRLGSVLSSSNTSSLKKGFFTLHLKLFPALHKTMSQLTAVRRELQRTRAKKIRVSFFYWEAASGISFKIIVFNFIKINMRFYYSIN